MRHLLLLLFLLLTTAASFSQNQPPVIDNIDINFNAADQMTITYDLQDAENDDAEISLRVSDDDGKTYTINTSGATGDIGYPVLPGNGKVIQWNYSGQIDMDGNYKLMLVADDRQPVDIQALVDGVDSTRLRNDLEVIEGVRHRTTGATHLENVKALIADRFDMYGLEDESVSWDRGGYDAKNIIGTKRGLSDQAEIYIIDGHFDTVDDSPGADDNGSAVAGVMEAARILAPYHFDKTIKFIGFDLEEAGLVGSNHFVNVDGLKAYETVGGVFNLEMIGYFNNTPNSQTFPFGFEQIYPQVYDTVRRDSFRGNFITNVGIETHPDLNQAFEDAATQYVPDLKVISLLATERWLLLTPDLGRSDHAPFWLDGYPALMLTDGSNFRNPYYHTPNDTVGTLNFTFMSQVVKATVAAVAQLAGITNSTFEIVDVEIVTSSSDLSGCDPQVFPNPSSDQIQIQLTDCLSQKALLEVYNLEGDQVYRQKITSSMYEIEIPTSDWSSGTYFLIIDTGDTSVQRKVILSR